MTANRLAHETSPYLLQHAHNPVQWYPWGPEALALAKELDRPILLSIGYSACHWCHVMERESFEDPEVAALMNEAFVNIKVDREERPDVDAVYMRAVQALTGRGGWPLTAFLTADTEPFYAGTYYPPEPRHGLPSFRQVLLATRKAWDERRGEVTRAATEIRALLERSQSQREGHASRGSSLDLEAILRRAEHELGGAFDPTFGGFGGAPKFPQPASLEFLLRRHYATGSEEALHIVLTTLRGMAHGGIRDHIGGGFHRYSVDAEWLVPHFEKMLYDNALLARLYVQAWQLSDDPLMLEAGVTTLDWLLGDMLDDGGAFYSAMDADSEGEEGVYYVWTPEELDDILDPAAVDLFSRVYGITPQGNFEGRNIPHLPDPASEVAAREGVAESVLRDRLEHARETLLAARQRREPPLTDHKVLAGWNGLAIRAFAEAGGALGEPRYIQAAETALSRVLETHRPEGKEGLLLRVYTSGKAHVPAFLEDWAALGNAALTLHEVTLSPRWLDETRYLLRGVVDRFWEESESCFYDTPHDGEQLVVRPREITDQATPSGTALAAELCFRAGHLLGDTKLTEIARTVLNREGPSIIRYPSAFGRLLAVAQAMSLPPLECAFVGNPTDEATRDLLDTFLTRYIPERTVSGHRSGSESSLPLLEGREGVLDADGRPLATAYLCRDFHCDAPVTSPEELDDLLSEALERTPR